MSWPMLSHPSYSSPRYVCCFFSLLEFPLVNFLVGDFCLRGCWVWVFCFYVVAISLEALMLEISHLVGN